MLSARSILASLLAVALAACGNGEKTDPGTGGTGGAGGSGGEGGGSTVDCRAARVLELDGSTSPAVLSDILDSADNWMGSCTPDDTDGNDVLVHFKAGEAGFYRFSTEGTDFDTVVFALEDCNDGFSEVQCNDNWGASKHSQLLLELDAGQEVFVVVDSVNVRQAQPFTLTATHVDVEPATIETMDAFFNPVVGTTGVRLRGSNPESDLVGFSMQVFGTNGSPLLQNRFTAGFHEVNIMWVVQADGTFLVEGSFYLGDTAPAVGSVEIAVVDQNGLTSEFMKVNTKAPPLVGRGDACDPNRALDDCGADDACRLVTDTTTWSCGPATAPTLTSATATVNLETGYWGIVVEGIDPESDVASIRILPRNASGTAIPVLQQPGAVLAPFYQLSQDETGFRGVMALEARFDAACLPPANQAYSNCVNRGGAEQTCYDDAVAMLMGCYAQKLTEVAEVDVEVVDATGRRSALMKVAVSPAAGLESTERCDPYEATGICPADHVCWSEPESDGDTCREEWPVCPEDYGVIDIMAHASGDRWVYTGNFARSANHGAATCGGGGPSDVLAFTAPAAGSYQMATSALGARVDTILSVRRFCDLPSHELACNDDQLLSATHSGVKVDLEEGDTVYILVDSFMGQTAGAYTLTVSGL